MALDMNNFTSNQNEQGEVKSDRKLRIGIIGTGGIAGSHIASYKKQPDVWYATNIEIYDYVSAYRSLVFSADGSTVYNPTLLTVWFTEDGKLFSVKSGETLIIK